MNGSPQAHAAHHARGTAENPMLPASRDLIRVGRRRWFLQTGLSALAGLSMADVLRLQAQAAPAGKDRRAVILFWLSGGPSHIDMWDPKPHAPHEIRGPYRPIATSVPGIQVCEHLPLQASIMHKLTLVRSVDCSASDHTPITMQAGNELARRTNDGRDGGGYPSMGSVAARLRGPNHPAMLAFVGLADKWKSDVWGAGNLGSQYEPVSGQDLLGKLAMPQGMNVDRLQDRRTLRREFDDLSRRFEHGDREASSDRYNETAFEMVVTGKVRKALDVSQETDAMRDAYGRVSIGEKALLARRLVEAGSTFVLVSGAWGYFDHHGDEVNWGGIQKGLTPLLPTVDRVIYTLVNDLETRGLLDSTLILMMGEFGRSPVLTPTAGRGHWTNAMSMLVAGGGIAHGKVIGATDRKGYEVRDARVRPADLAATTFHHLGIDLNAEWINPAGRPMPIVTGNGRPVPGLV